MSLSTELKNIVGMLLSSRWTSTTISYGTVDEPKPKDGHYMVLRLVCQKKKNGYINEMICEKFNEISNILNVNVEITKIDTNTHIGGKIQVKEDQYDELRKELRLLW